MSDDQEDLALDLRAGLPDPLRALVKEFPRDGWEQHPEFQGLISFWLDRHLMFRRLCEAMIQDAQTTLDGGMEPRQMAGRLSRYGSALVNDLHGHHQIEDGHYFPRLTTLDARMAHGFDLLERDHAQMDGLIAGFVDAANTVLAGADAAGGATDRVGAFHAHLGDFSGLLERHLFDEEEIVVPVILKYGANGL
ncbi:hemerythrin domain-containing protein [Mesobacterium pallidum]|uniref:hemerythrin domain-containing protein n=1 Tax=Mesobacterium pallidum TaxID=2872037 RepID=UPI001EE3338F|nr:hemerythrin domain-containing protein [Mesobacterium pallidum]